MTGSVSAMLVPRRQIGTKSRLKSSRRRLPFKSREADANSARSLNRCAGKTRGVQLQQKRNSHMFTLSLDGLLLDQSWCLRRRTPVARVSTRVARGRGWRRTGRRRSRACRSAATPGSCAPRHTGWPPARRHPPTRGTDLSCTGPLEALPAAGLGEARAPSSCARVQACTHVRRAPQPRARRPSASRPGASCAGVHSEAVTKNPGRDSKYSMLTVAFSVGCV